MSQLSATSRLNSANADIHYLTNEINYHDKEASRLRKLREKHKAKRDRAIAAIERCEAAESWDNSNDASPD